MRPFSLGRARPTAIVSLPTALVNAMALAPAVGAAVSLPTAQAYATALAPTASSSSGGILQPGVRYWGACGHLDQGGPYQSVSYANQAAHLKSIFGNTPNTVLYRAFGDARAYADIHTDVVAFQALSIIPVVMCITYPDWGSFANEAAAYAWAYAELSDLIGEAPTIQLFEIGNEWNLQVAQPGGSDGLSESEWTGLSFYPLFRGALAGAIQAIRDLTTDTQVIAAATSGWVKLGFVPALANDLASIYGLAWDFTCCHWYNGEAELGFGLPSAINGGSESAYEHLRPASADPKPILFTEFGASTSGSSEAEAAARITGLMDDFYAQGVSATATELGSIGGTVFDLYAHGIFTDYELCGTDGTLTPQGTAVKNWIDAHP